MERDHIVSTVLADGHVTMEVIRDFSTGYHSRNGGGDLIQTDGDLPIIDARGVAAPALAPVELTDSRDKRPVQIVFGAGVSLLRGLVFLLVGVGAIFVPAEVLPMAGTDAAAQAGSVVVGVVLVVVSLVDIGLALAMAYGRNWARLVLMVISVVAVLTAFVDNARRLEVITLATLPTVALSILILLALSSHRARDFTAGAARSPGP